MPRRSTIWMIVGQGPTAFAVGAGGGCLLFFFSFLYHFFLLSPSLWGGRVVRRCWGVLLFWIIVGQGPIVLAVGGDCLDIFLSSITSLFFLPLSGRRHDID